MKIVMFYHSLLSDWNHGNAHFLRGVATELIERGNDVEIYEPENNWSFSNLVKDHGEDAVEEFYRYYPLLKSATYRLSAFDFDKVLSGADLVIVHEWNEHQLVKALGEKKKKYGYKLLFHDTHHRAVSERASMAAYDLRHYDGVLAFGDVITNIYLQEQWTQHAWTWHEAADTRLFKPLAADKLEGDLVWIGNWGDEERTRELFEFIIEPVQELGLSATIYGVRYPEHARAALKKAGIRYGGWLPNYKVPEVFSRYRFTVHVPRRPYVEKLSGIPTIRPFEAMACGILLLSAPWYDSEGLFRPGKDFLFVQSKKEMLEQMQQVLTSEEKVRQMTTSGLETIRQHHTCAHRVDQLYSICKELGMRNLEEMSTMKA